MGSPNISNEESLYRFLEEHGGNRVKRELLFFWGSHPNTKFAGNAIGYALDSSKLEVENALRELVKARIVDAYIMNDVTFYSLTANEERRRPVLELSSLHWGQWHLMVKRIEQGHEVAKAST